MKKFQHFLIIFTLVFSAQTATLFSQISSNGVDTLVITALKKFDVAGAAVGIVKDGKIIHAKGYGVKSIETGEPVNENTLFAIASNSKAFTTTALSILIEEGKLNWKDRVKDYIPEFKMYNSYVTENFNIQDLLTHRSGLGLGAGDLMHFPDGSDFTIDDIIKNFQYFEPVSAFRTKFDYDNLLYMVAGEIIKRVSGMKWEDFVRNRIMKPLGMNNSYTNFIQITDTANTADPHANTVDGIKKISHYIVDPDKINGAAGAIYSNVDDLCRWMLVHLNGGRYGEDLESRLFSTADHREMWKIHTVLNANTNPRYNSHFAGYGLGWFLTDLNGKMSVSHTGGLPGMLSKQILIPDLNLGIVVLTNTAEGGAGVFRAVTQTVVDSYLGLDDYNWIDYYFDRYQKSLSEADSVSSKVWEFVNSADDDAINFTDYSGIYKDDWFGKVEVFIKGDQLWFRSFRSPKLTGELRYYKANAFAAKWDYQDMNADAFVVFSLDEEGKAQSFTMKGISPDIDFSFDFQDLFFTRLEE